VFRTAPATLDPAALDPQKIAPLPLFLAKQPLVHRLQIHQNTGLVPRSTKSMELPKRCSKNLSTISLITHPKTRTGSFCFYPTFLLPRRDCPRAPISTRQRPALQRGRDQRPLPPLLKGPNRLEGVNSLIKISTRIT
jgi:hypothetical protein